MRIVILFWFIKVLDDYFDSTIYLHSTTFINLADDLLSMVSKPVLLVFGASFLLSCAQLLLKKASGSFALTFVGIFQIELILGIALLGITAVLFVIALRGGELTVLYPLMATSYVWVAIASPIIFPSDSLNTLKMAGIGSIIIGVYSIARGNR